MNEALKLCGLNPLRCVVQQTCCIKFRQIGPRQDQYRIGPWPNGLVNSRTRRIKENPQRGFGCGVELPSIRL